MSLPAFKTSKHQQFGSAIAAVAIAGMGFLPLFGGPSYEFALACGIIVPLVAACTNALEVAKSAPAADAAFRRGIYSGLVFAALSVAIALAHGVRAGFCDPLSQMPLFFLGPVPGAIMGALWGAGSGLLASTLDKPKTRAALAVVLALLAPVVSIAFSFGRYYTSPMIFAFDHFVGFFAGTLYDTEIDGTKRLLSYRAGTLGWVLFAYALSQLLVRSGRSFSLVVNQRMGSLLLGVLGLCLGSAIAASGPELGHYQTAETIRAELGHVAEAKRCEIVYASGVIKRDAHALARDCDAYVEQHERFFEVQFEGRVTVFLFHSAGQKARLMGARNVYIAKPWRKEIYIQHRSYPHPVLGHELAHVIAGVFAKGPFLVAGPMGGWIPDPGRIEGVAVAAAPREDDDLTLQEWSRAMKDLELLPPLNAVFKLSFLGENSSKAYTVAGAFIRWLHDSYGADAVKQWYAGQRLEQAAGKPLPELEKEWHDALQQVQVSETEMAVAKARFSRPAIFGRTCPHQVDKMNRQAARALGRNDPSKALGLYQDVLALDADDYTARLGVGDCAYKQAQLDEAIKQYESVAADERMTVLARAYARERIANAEWAGGKPQQAQKLYGEVAESVVGEHHLRTLDIKRLIGTAQPADSAAHAGVQALLLGDPTLGTDWAVAGAELGRWAELEPKNGLPDYLLGKNYFNRGRWKEAAERLDSALSKRIELPRVEAEALRTRLFVACALGQKRSGQEAFNRFEKQKSVAPARREGVRSFAERCGLEVPGVKPKPDKPPPNKQPKQQPGEKAP